jgi:hypothetical protein
MAGATYVLDKTYRIVNASGVDQFIAVGNVATPADGDCDLPSAAAVFCLGITQEAQANQNENVTVRKYGISRFVGKGTIHVGDALEIATTAGDLQAATLTAGTAAVHHIVGTSESELADGETGFCFLSPHYVSVPAS